MTKIKNIGFTGIFLAAGALAPAIMANSVVLTQTEFFYADGGEFTAVTTGNDFAQFYAPTTRATVGDQTGFQTFCVEASVYFWPNVSYSYTLGNADSQGRDLTQGTAWLYAQFAEGVLTGYDFNNNIAGGSRTQDAGLLQSAIWALQGNQNGGGAFPSGIDGNPYYALAASAMGADLLAPASPDQFGVQILQLWDSNNNTYQNQLAFDDPPPVPDHGTTLAYLALSLASLAVASTGVAPRQLALQRCASSSR